jgi:hypothetical protein
VENKVAGHAARTATKSNTYSIVVGNSERNKQLEITIKRRILLEE